MPLGNSPRCGRERKLRILWAIAGFLIPLAPIPCRSESTSEAIRVFGIVGSWSPDCAGSLRFTYATPFFGAPTMSAGANGKEYLVVDVQEAVRVSEEKLKITVHVKKQETPNFTPIQLKVFPQLGEIWEYVYLKVGNKVRIYSSKQKDGDRVGVKDGFRYSAKEDGNGGFSMENTGKLMPLNEKCLS